MTDASRDMVAASHPPAANPDGGEEHPLVREVASLAQDLALLRREVIALAPARLGRDDLPQARAELSAVMRETETGADQILSAAEALLTETSGQDEAFQARVHDHALTILSACAFQDLTGQRLGKVLDLLSNMEGRMRDLVERVGVVEEAAVESAEQRRQRELMLNGPALNGPEVSQDAIDALFD